MRSRTDLWHHTLAILLITAAACDGGTEPESRSYAIDIRGGDHQFGGAGQALADPLRVVVSDARTREPVKGVSVQWQVVGGRGAVLNPSTSVTDSLGLASTGLKLGADTGSYRVQAAVRELTGEPATFQARAILQPRIASVAPLAASAGDTVVLQGEHFSPNPGDHAVTFDGFRGTILTATATEIRALVPRCVPTRRVDVAVWLGAVSSAPVGLDVTGDGSTPIDLAVGEALALSDPDALSCIRLPGGQTGISFLVMPQNATDVSGRALPFQLLGLTGQSSILASFGTGEREPALSGVGPGEGAAAWESELRAREREISPEDVLRPLEGPRLRVTATPSVGDRKEFFVYNKDEKFTRVTAEVKYVSTHAVLYQDVNAPAGGLTATDFAQFGDLFDDPIHNTTTSVFGQPSDIDANGKVIVLLTPVVNELTTRGSPGFIAGFFYGLDLTTQANSNRAEIFYSLVPDPEGKHSDKRTRDDVLYTVPPVLAHEFQHMIHFNQRVLIKKAAQESLWLSEAMAHMAEDVVAGAFRDRGDLERERIFNGSNFARAIRYLGDPGAASLIAITSPGSLEERGAQWLFLKYLVGHFGGNELLKQLTQTATAGVGNVEEKTGTAWGILVNHWSLALWADDSGVKVDSIYTFPNINLRTALGARGYPLQPPHSDFQDFVLADTLPAAGPEYMILTAQLSTKPLHLSVTAPRGASFDGEARPRFSILRIK